MQPLSIPLDVSAPTARPSGDAFFARAAAPDLLLIAISALPLYLLVVRERAG